MRSSGSSPPLRDDVSGRSGAYIERVLFVPPRFARLLVALTADAESQFRASGTAMPADLRDWLSDLTDFAQGERAAVVGTVEPVAWLDVSTAAGMYSAAGVALSERAVRQMASDGRLRAKRVGRPWRIAFEAVELDIANRKDRKSIGGRYPTHQAPSQFTAVDDLEATA
jgi:excisionase family DNA binding protein